jgi:hypothetical protein
VFGEAAYAAGCVLGAALAWAARVPSHRKGTVPWIALTLTATAAAAVVGGVLHVAGRDTEVTLADALRVVAYVPLSVMLLRRQAGGVRRAGPPCTRPSTRAPHSR